MKKFFVQNSWWHKRLNDLVPHLNNEWIKFKSIQLEFLQLRIRRADARCRRRCPPASTRFCCGATATANRRWAWPTRRWCPSTAAPCSSVTTATSCTDRRSSRAHRTAGGSRSRYPAACRPTRTLVSGPFQTSFAWNLSSLDAFKVNYLKLEDLSFRFK